MDKSEMKSVPVKPSEITPEHIYLSRREFMKGLAVVGAASLLAACGQSTGQPASQPTSTQPANSTTKATSGVPSSGNVDEQGDPLNTYSQITNYNNYYEFTTEKEGVAVLSKDFKTSPWEVQVSGLVKQPKTYAMEDLLKKFTQQERIYRLRCVEAWSMVIPWQGFRLADLLKEVEPTGDAKYVRFESLLDPGQMPGQSDPSYPWPYQEGLRLDEAMNDLTLLATGLYGKPLPPQDGAPIRLVVPWKYGFKSIKAVIKIELVAQQPPTMWSTIAPNEYGFYANVNPEVDHPRWSQASERRIGELQRRKTLMFNGYSEQVASLYQGMDLRANY